MKRNFNTVVKAINNDDMMEQNAKGEQIPVTMKSIALTALLTTQEGDDKLNGTKKIALVELAMKINSTDELDVTAEEIVTLKERVSKIPYNNHMVLYRVDKFLEGE